MIKNMYQLAMQTMKPWGFRPTRILSRCSNKGSSIRRRRNRRWIIRQTYDRTTTELWRWKIMYWYGLASGMVYLYLQFHYKPPNFGFWDWYIYIYVYIVITLVRWTEVFVLRRWTTFARWCSKANHRRSIISIPHATCFCMPFFHRPNSRF